MPFIRFEQLCAEIQARRKYIYQRVIDKNGKRVIFRVIDQKLQITIFPALSYILHSALSFGMLNVRR